MGTLVLGPLNRCSTRVVMAYLFTLDDSVILQEPHPDSSDLVGEHTKPAECLFVVSLFQWMTRIRRSGIMRCKLLK